MQTYDMQLSRQLGCSGLGQKITMEWNLVLLAKLGWHLMHESNQLWVRVGCKILGSLFSYRYR